MQETPRLSKAEDESFRFTSSPWSLEKKEADGASIIVRFWFAPESQNVSRLIIDARKQATRCTSGTFPKAPSHCSRGQSSPFPRLFLFPKVQLSRYHSSFWEIAIPSLILPVPGKTDAATDLLDHAYIHGDHYAARSSLILNVHPT